MNQLSLFKSIFLLFILYCYTPTFAQGEIWHIQQKDKIDFSQDIRIKPNTFLSYTINPAQLQQQLATAPNEEDYLDNNATPLLIELPNPDGNFTSFHIIAYDMMEEDLKNKWSFLKNWRGWQVDNPQTTIRLDWTDKGFHAMVYEKGKHWFIDPLYWDKKDAYQVYYKRDYPLPNEPFRCGVKNQDVEVETHNIPQVRTPNGDCSFRTYRTAIACTGEYATFHGGTVQGAASAINTSLNRLNGVYESELALRLILVANNDLLIYLDGNTDPYTNSSGSTMLGQNQQNIDQVIGTSNYDIGHVYSTGGGGVANLWSPCNSNLKARGVTGRGAPVGDPFDIDYVAHEMGHQFGGNHTQNSQCNRNGSTAVEPGSATTIMGYAGVCSPNNVQNYSDAYYHGISIQEISNYMHVGGGSQCATIIDMSNSSPANIQAGDDKFIPANTPFVLTASATDSDPLSYNWEQFDTELAENTPPQSSNTQGPLFRSFYATSSPSRYFPRLTDLANNVDATWEELPGVSRDMTFRVTVRDLNNAYGCSSYDEITLSVQGDASDFSVLEPNEANVEWEEFQTYPVVWKVANTDVAPINCTKVDIFLSLDGGLTYPIRLDSAVANSGSATITLPEIEPSNQARVMVKCSDNVFFNISNTDFTVIDEILSLPLDWISFEAFAKENNGLLKWETENENNVSHFEIERRTDDSDFKKIARIEAANRREQNTYEFVDKQISYNTSYYYRIKQVDFDNAYSYSTIKSIQLKTEKPSCIVSPNPTNGIFNIKAAQGIPLPDVRVFNTLGQEIAEDIFRGNKGLEISLINTTHSFYTLLLEWATGEPMMEKVFVH